MSKSSLLYGVGISLALHVAVFCLGLSGAPPRREDPPPTPTPLADPAPPPEPEPTPEPKPDPKPPPAPEKSLKLQLVEIPEVDLERLADATKDEDRHEEPTPLNEPEAAKSASAVVLVDQRPATPPAAGPEDATPPPAAPPAPAPLASQPAQALAPVAEAPTPIEPANEPGDTATSQAPGDAEGVPSLRIHWRGEDELRALVRAWGIRVVLVHEGMAEDGAGPRVVGQLAFLKDSAHVVAFDGDLREYSNRVREISSRLLPKVRLGAEPIRGTFWVLVPRAIDQEILEVQRRALAERGLAPASVASMEASFTRAGGAYRLVVTAVRLVQPKEASRG